MKAIDLFTPLDKEDFSLANRIVMSSLTRGRTTNAQLAPTELHAEYYAQRASAGLILTESAWVSQDAMGFINIPGIYTQEQIDGWKKVTEAVHLNGGKIFLQLAHSGSVSHADFFDGRLPKGPSAINPQEKSFTPHGFKDTETPEELSKNNIARIIDSYKIAAENALSAGFDGIEIHAQLFTLIPQFLSRATNHRNDEYGGGIENRSRILFEILEAVITIMGADRVGVKFTPSAYNPGIIRPDADTLEDYKYLLTRLNRFGLAYLHIVGPSVDLSDTPLAEIKDDYFGFFRLYYNGTLIANLGFNKYTANEILQTRKADLVSFGTAFIANPDLVGRFKNDWTLAEADADTYYTGGEKGYTDYPLYQLK
ncbi:alkene reductase [Chryseobacterium tongliaoense]|uniref:alkene reductase n=1 Tax=Chryseobacterium tongliaoense TaxID=3240933 RepID=UPI003512CDED